MESKLERESRMKTYNKNNNNSKVLEKEAKTVTWPHSVHSLRGVRVTISLAGCKHHSSSPTVEVC